MNGNGSITIERLTALLPGAVLLPIPRREKAPRGFDAKDWQNTTFEETQRHHYQARLRQAENTGVLLGQPSGSLCAIDIDDDELIQGFLDLNPDFARTLCSKGQRGCQFWVIIEGDYPHQVAKLKHPGGRTYGEWRADGGQSVIRGIHPEGMHYQLLCASPPVRIRFDQIRWPLDWVLPWKNSPPITELPTVVAPAPSAEISDRVRAYLDKVDPAISGQDGHGKTFWAACVLVWGFAMDQEQALPFLREYSGRCQPPWNEKELQHKLDSALKSRRHPKPRGYLLNERELPKIKLNDAGLNGAGSDLVETIRKLEIYYDSPRTKFWARNDREGWIMVGQGDVVRFLAKAGYRTARQKKEKVSQVDELLIAIEKSADVDYAGSLAGYRAAVYEIGGNRILVRNSPEIIEPCRGKWNIIHSILRNMLGPQRVYFYGWLKTAYESLYSRQNRVGQALTFAGPKDCGKSLAQNQIITPILGGRSAKAHRYMTGETTFNGELFGAEHLMIEDDRPSTDIRARRSFGTRIKEITANTVQSCHPKGRPAISLEPFWRLSISLNDEPEDLLVLPPIDDAIEDKIIILKAVKHAMPMPSTSWPERQALAEAIRAELSAFLYFLINWEIPAELASPRYGITHFHDPDIMNALQAMSPEAKLLDLIDTELFDSPPYCEWRGSAADLERHLTRPESQVKRQAEKLLGWELACGTYLGRLAKAYSERFKSRHTMKGNEWTISPPN